MPVRIHYGLDSQVCLVFVAITDVRNIYNDVSLIASLFFCYHFTPLLTFTSFDFVKLVGANGSRSLLERQKVDTNPAIRVENRPGGGAYR